MMNLILKLSKKFDENAALHMSKPFTWINMLNAVGSIAPMIGLLGTVVGMLVRFLQVRVWAVRQVNKWQILLVLFGQHS